MTRIELSIEAPEGAMSLTVQGDDTLKLIRSAMARATAAYSVAAAEGRAAELAAPPLVEVQSPPAELMEKIQAARESAAVGMHRGRPFDKSTGLPLPAPIQNTTDEAEETVSAPVTAQENAGPKPWEVADVEADGGKVAAPAKKSGRRTNEEIAAELGVSLDDVKEWAGEGVRISKSKIEEFAKLHPAAVSMNNQDLQQAAEQPQAASAPQGQVEMPSPQEHAVEGDDDQGFYDPAQDEEGFSEMPTAAFGSWDPFGKDGAQQQPQAAPAADGGDEKLPF